MNFNNQQLPPQLTNINNINNVNNINTNNTNNHNNNNGVTPTSDHSSDHSSTSSIGSQKRSLPDLSSTNIGGNITKSPPTKKRKKNGTTHSKLIEEFAQRSHLRNSVNLSSYHGKKQNIKTLCPYHDMLPVINVMEKEVFNNQKEVCV